MSTTETKTPGPWVISQYLDDGRWGVVTSENEIIVSVRSGEGQLSEANARLIAHAPEMAAKLQAAIHCMRSYEYGNHAPDLAKEMADSIERLLTQIGGHE
jgi:hypothetical protein